MYRLFCSKILFYRLWKSMMNSIKPIGINFHWKFKNECQYLLQLINGHVILLDLKWSRQIEIHKKRYEYSTYRFVNIVPIILTAKLIFIFEKKKLIKRLLIKQFQWFYHFELWFNNKYLKYANQIKLPTKHQLLFFRGNILLKACTNNKCIHYTQCYKKC